MVRFKANTLDKSSSDANIETLELAHQYGSLMEVVAQGSVNSSCELASGSYILKGKGFLTIDSVDYYPVSYTHLTLPTNREV